MNARILLSAVLLLGASSACADYVFERKIPESLKEVNRVVPAARPTPADILFVIDNSGSMADEQENLARNFENFINVLTEASGDFQMAIVTTDLSERYPTERAGLRTYQFKASPPYTLNLSGTVESCSDTGIPHGCFRGSDPAKRIIRSTQLNREQQITTFVDNVRVGSCGDGEERGLAAILAALQKTSAGQCNEGFLRSDANLIVIIVSDEEDEYSGGDTSTYVNELVRLKGDASRVRMAAIVGSRDGQASRCGAQPTCGNTCNSRPANGSGQACVIGQSGNCPVGETCAGSPSRCENSDLLYWQNCWWCSYYNSPDCCSANSGGRYVELATAMEVAITQAVPGIPRSNCRAPVGTRAACLIDSICQQEFAGTLARIARDLVLSNEFILEPPASYPPGVVVKLNGVALVQCSADNAATCGFTVNVNAEGLGVSVSVPGAGEGDEIEIYYITPE